MVPVIGWLRSALRRLSPRARTIALVVLLLAAAVLALAPTHTAGHRAQQPSTRARTSRTTRNTRHYVSPVPAARLARARQIARTFLAGYLPFAYGRASASSVPVATSALRRELTGAGAQVTPVERSRHPRVVALTALGQASKVVVVTALINDRGITTYAVRLTLQQRRSGWLVNGVDEG